MSAEEDKRASQRLSWALRHGARELGLAMDAAGWVSVGELRRALSLGEEQLARVIAGNNKARFEQRGETLRAAQGHSLAGTPVTLEALEASWITYDGAGPVWHGTSLEVLEPIDREGLLPGERTHVHLAAAVDSAVGKRAGVDVLLAVDPARLRAEGLGLFVSGNGVVLARRVPRGALVGVRALTRRARAQSATWEARFGRA